jgi:hypothetical protein
MGRTKGEFSPGALVPRRSQKPVRPECEPKTVESKTAKAKGRISSGACHGGRQ